MPTEDSTPTNKLPAPPPAPSDTPMWVSLAEREVGVQELSGQLANPRIVEYLKTVHLPTAMANSDETPWCSAFMNWVMERCGFPGTGKANARSWLSWGSPMVVPKRGAVLIFSADTRGKTAGHVTLCYEQFPGTRIEYRCLGGNQNNRVGLGHYPASRLIGVRWPSYGVPPHANTK